MSTSSGGAGSGGASAGGAPVPPLYTLRIDAPLNGASVQGVVAVVGQGPGFVNVEVWDAVHQSPPLSQVAPNADGTFTMTVDTSTLASGPTTWTVHAWDVPAGGNPTRDASVPLSVTIVGGAVPDAGPGGAVHFVMGAENKNGSQSDFEAAVQCDVNINQITTGWCGDWNSWASTGCGVFPEVSAFYAADSRHAVELSLTPWPQALGGQSYAACARGDYDAHYGSIARSILSSGMRHVLIRLGYEWDGGWFPWGTGLHETGNVGNGGPGGSALEYAACFRRFDAAIQAVARGASSPVYFRTVLNPIHDTVATKQTQLRQVLDAAGGRRSAGGTVDFLGVDFYDYPARNNFASRMNAIVAFGKSYGIPLAFPEWGVGGDSRAQPGVDDAGEIYMRGMYDYFSNPDNGIHYASYFNCATNDCAGNHSLIPPNNPRSRAAYTSLFGNGRLGCGANARTMLEQL